MKKTFTLKIGRLILPTILSLGFFSASVSQGQTLNDIYWNPFNTNGLGGSGSWSASPTNWSLNSAGSAQANNIIMPTVGTNLGQSAYYRFNFGGSNGTVNVGSSQSALGAVNITSSGYIFSQSGNFSGGGTVGGVATNATTTLGSGVRVDFSCTANGAWTISSNSIIGAPDGSSSIYLTGTNASAGTYSWSFTKTTTVTNVTIYINSQGPTNSSSAMILQNGSSATGGHPSINANIVNNSSNGVPLTLSVASSGNLTNAGTISGSNAVIIRIPSSGNIILAASNSYTGGTVITNTGSGNIDLDKVLTGHFGSGDIVIANGTTNYVRALVNAIDITNNIRIDGVFRESVNNSGWRITNSGTLTGAGSILLTNSGSNLYLTGTNNSFGGGVFMGSLIGLYVNRLGTTGQNSSIGTNGTITVSGTAAAATVGWWGTNNEISDKSFSLLGTSSNAAGVKIYAGDNSGGGTNVTLTINGNITSGSGTNQTITLGAYSTNTLVVNGVISQNTGTTNSLVIGVSGASGTVVLGNTNNSFGAPISLALGSSSTNILQVAQIGNSGANSPLGTNGTISIGGASTSGLNVLRYTGSGETSDKTLNHSGTGGDLTLDQSGTGNLKFTSPMSATGISPKNVVLQGSTAGTGELSGNINDLGGNVTSLTKRGTGTWILSGSNSYSGLTTIFSGALRIMGANSVPVGGVVAGSSTLGNNSTLDVGSAGNYALNSFGSSTTAGGNLIFTNSSGSTASITFTNATNCITLSSGTSAGRAISNSSTSLQVTFVGAVDVGSSSNQAITFSGAGNIAINGTLFNNGTSNSLPSIRSIVKTGTGVLSLAGINSVANGYNGTTTISAGILSLDAAGALGTNSVVLDGGTLRVNSAGLNESKGNLLLTNNSTIDLGTASSGVLRFATATGWSAGRTLTITNSSGGAQLYILNTTGLDKTQIKSAENPSATASFDQNGLLTFSAGVVPPNGLSYNPSSVTGTVGTAITNLTPSVTGTVTSYSVSPTLPAGLSLNTSTGVISGTPSAVASSASYTVTAANSGGSTTASVTIVVNAAGPTFDGAYANKNLLDVAPNGLTYLVNYAFGGSDTTKAMLPFQDTSDPGKLALVAYVRTGDSSLSVGGQAAASLDFSSPSSASYDVITPSDAPAGMEKRRYSVSVSGNRQFLRLIVTKQ